MRELEDMGMSVIGQTLREAKKVVKESCKHPGGILPADECIKIFINRRNEAKLFVGTNDEDLRNDLRNLGTVPIFFFKHNVLVMDSPTEITEEKHRIVRLFNNLILTLYRKSNLKMNLLNRKNIS
jgi:rRNA-processing protein FCF1